LTRKYFGTDGIRGRVGEPPITADFMLKLGWAAGKVFSEKSTDRKLILVGKDTRISGYMFESALQSGLIAAGVNVGLLGPMPTPAIAYLTRTFRAQAGIVISASHNPFDDNGIKFFGGDGYKLADDVEKQIESFMDQPLLTSTSSQLGRAHRIADAAGRYIEFCKGTLPTGFTLNGLKIVVDCANGATYHVAPDVLSELGANVIAVSDKPNGLNINDNCGSTHLQPLARKVLEEGADMGIAFDGDGDRVLMVNHKGDVVDGDEILYIIAKHRLERGKGCDGVVGTLMSNYGLEMAFKNLGIPFTRAKVGDRYVMEAMRANDWIIGGENSGHIICQDQTTTGDGLVAALQVLRAIAHSGKSLADLGADMHKLPQVMINVRIARKQPVDDKPEVKAAITAAEAELAGRGRVLLRPSGTEPVIRVMVEGEEVEQVQRLAENIAETVARVVG